MGKQLQVIAGPDEGRIYALPESDTLLLGRSRALEARLVDPHVSRVHCQIEVEGDRVRITDFESGAGIFVNNKRASQQILQSGDVIRIGNTFLQYSDGDIAEQKTLPPDVPTSAKTVAPPAASRLAQLVGQTFSHYKIGPILAKGQSGLVFHARDTSEDRPVALKVLWPDFVESEDKIKRFVRAMKTALPLRHPNLVSVYGAGRKGPYCWVAMEYVEGESLTQVVQRMGTVGMLDWRNALRVGVHIARALEYAHQQQIIHRNVTPMNILLQGRDRIAKLGDLMLAKALEGILAEQITRPGQLLGEVLYMSPERTQGSANVDGRSDFYSLGASLYALLTGRPPFEGNSLAETISKIRSAEPIRPKKYHLAIPDLFEGTVLRMLAKRPEDRFQKAGDMLAELERVAKFQGVQV
jgi:serine/threonine protein kinase